MALAFNQAKGTAQKTNIEQYSYKNGDNSLRLVGDLLARYVYWIEGENGKNIPFECLSFDREKEAFINKEKDWVREYYPDLRCGWSYACQGIDLEADEPKAVVVNLKRKLFDQILVAAEDLGDPTDPDTGWDIRFKRVKTGPLPYNVEYQLQVLKCKNRALDDDEREAIANLKSMDEVLPRPTPDAQKELLDRIQSANATDDKEVLDEEFDVE
jgi:hypothetical protein